MRVIFGLVGLLLVVLILGTVARSQLAALGSLAPAGAGTTPRPGVGSTAGGAGEVSPSELGSRDGRAALGHRVEGLMQQSADRASAAGR